MKIALWIIAVPVVLMGSSMLTDFMMLIVEPLVTGFNEGAGTSMDPDDLILPVLFIFVATGGYLANRVIVAVTSRRPVS